MTMQELGQIVETDQTGESVMIRGFTFWKWVQRSNWGRAFDGVQWLPEGCNDL